MSLPISLCLQPSFHQDIIHNMQAHVVFVYLLFSTFSSMSNVFICRQISLKPPGQSTVIDLIIRDFLYNLTLSNSANCLTLALGLLFPLPDWYIHSFIYVAKLSALCVLLEWLAMSLLRYGYIFHWARFANLEDGKLLLAARSLYFGLGFVLNTAEIAISGQDADFKSNYKVTLHLSISKTIDR